MPLASPVWHLSSGWLRGATPPLPSWIYELISTSSSLWVSTYICPACPSPELYPQQRCGAQGRDPRLAAHPMGQGLGKVTLRSTKERDRSPGLRATPRQMTVCTQVRVIVLPELAAKHRGVPRVQMYESWRVASAH